MRVQELRNERAFKKARTATNSPSLPLLEQANFARRSFAEKQMALNLAQFASANKDLNLGSDNVANLVGTLIVSGTPFCLTHDVTSASSPCANLVTKGRSTL